LIEIRRISVEPWDYTLYEASDGLLILKVIFSEGDYKMDVGRFFMVDSEYRDSDVEKLKSLSAAIRDDFPNVRYEQVEKKNLQIVT
jgi:hypothetical protein